MTAIPQPPHQWTPPSATLSGGGITALRRTVGPERFSTYDTAVGGDQVRAVDLYVWNAAVSAAFFEDLSMLEVALRNACHYQLQAWNANQGHKHPWYHHPTLEPRHMQDVGTARNRVTQGKNTETEGRVVAELMFGFWRLLHAKNYEHLLWIPCLRMAYPNLQPSQRSLVYDRLDHLNTLRNRIAHHEPVHGTKIGKLSMSLAQVHGQLLDLIAWMDTDLHSWVATNSKVPQLIAQKP
jgi:hypothetical protein